MSATVSSSLQGNPALNRGMQSDRLDLTETLITLFIFLYWVVNEHLIFSYPMFVGGAALVIFTNGIKLLLPLCLLVFTGLPSPRMVGRGPVGLYLLFFSVFLLWGLVPTLASDSGNPISWFKLLPRFVFFLGLIAFFSKRPAAFALYSKCIVVYVLIALLQYFLIYSTGTYEDLSAIRQQLAGRGFPIMAGPFGLLGNVTASFFIEGAPFPIVRLCGFWNEPSNASGSAFAAFFLARYLVLAGEGKVWRKASYACLVAGLLALSNAGYFALGSALLFGAIFGVNKLTAWRATRSVLLVPVAVALLVIVVFGRSYVIENMSDNVWARAIVGVSNIAEVARDPTAGRLDLLAMTVETAESEIIGIGLQPVGPEGIDASASAPLHWLLLTGIPGLLLLLGRETVLLVFGCSLMRRLPAMLPLVQALVVVMAQHLSYGSWMNPDYLILAAMILVCSHRSTQQFLTARQLSHGHG